MANASSVADMANALRGADFPAGRAALRKQAQSNNALDETVSAIELGPHGTFASMADVARPYAERAYAEEDTGRVCRL
jgi:hypothetical protein